MSQALAAPSPDFDSWSAKLKQAFGFDAVGKQAGAAKGALQKRLLMLANTAAYARKQPPDVAIRILQDLSGELETTHDAIKQADGVGLTGDALVLRTHVNQELAKIPAKALAKAQQDATGWLAEIAAVPAAARPADNKARAKLLLPLINKVVGGLAEDEAMLARVNADGRPIFAPVKSEIGTLRLEYDTLLPKRTAGVEPKAPTGEVKRPQLGDGAEPKTLKDNLALIETEMANSRAPDPAKLEEAILAIQTAIDCVDAKKEMIALGTWDAVKEKYHTLAKADGPTGAAFMAKMWWFRRQAVDAAMTALQKEYGFVWGSVGSANPESDYDVTVRTHGTKKDGSVYYDYQIVADFNKAVSAPFGGTPPGILFDTNLYAEAAVAPTWDRETPTGRDMSAMTEQGQDVGALMKLRRYMEWDDYEDYKQKTLAAMPKEQRALTLRQFEEADSLYFIARAEQLTEAGIPIDGIPTTPQGQKTLLEKAAALDHDGATAMETNNALYLKKIEEVRGLEKTLLAESDADKKSALLAKLRSLQADATFFAAEAYHSEGPLKHVVQAGQSSKLEVANDPAFATATPEAKGVEVKKRTTAKLTEYTPTQMLQSFNENLGDLLKDLRHYESEPFPGLGFYRSSKYLERLCDAANWTASKLGDPAKAEYAKLRLGDKTPAQVQAAVGGLVAIRGESKVFKSKEADPIGGVADPEQEKQAYAIDEMSRIFPGVTTLRELGKVATAFGQQVNALVRSSVTAQMAASDEAAYFQATART